MRRVAASQARAREADAACYNLPVKPIAIIDYGAGNLRSVMKAFERLGHPARFASEPGALTGASAVVFPGQGASPQAAAALEARGIAGPLRDWIADGRPFFGVCLGLQLLLDHSEEGDTPGLGVVSGRVKRFPPGLKTPHMGWNTVSLKAPHPLFDGAPEERRFFYFAHSYYALPDDASWVAGETSYGLNFPSALARENVVATQFHPEKSGAAGLAVYDNFARRFAKKR